MAANESFRRLVWKAGEVEREGQVGREVVIRIGGGGVVGGGAPPRVQQTLAHCCHRCVQPEVLLFFAALPEFGLRRYSSAENKTFHVQF